MNQKSRPCGILCSFQFYTFCVCGFLPESMSTTGSSCLHDIKTVDVPTEKAFLFSCRVVRRRFKRTSVRRRPGSAQITPRRVSVPGSSMVFQVLHVNCCDFRGERSCCGLAGMSEVYRLGGPPPSGQGEHGRGVLEALK